MIINILLFFECHLVLLKFIQPVYTIKLKQYDKYSIVVCTVTTYKCRLGMFWCLPWFWNAWNPYALKNENKSYATDRIEMFRIIWSLSIGKWHWKMPNNVCFNPPVIHTWQKLFTCIPGRSWRARLKNLFEHKRQSIVLPELYPVISLLGLNYRHLYLLWIVLGKHFLWLEKINK